jgi:hypothetical protein
VRSPVERCKVLTCILFGLKTGIAWDHPPAELAWSSAR